MDWMFERLGVVTERVVDDAPESETVSPERRLSARLAIPRVDFRSRPGSDVDLRRETQIRIHLVANREIGESAHEVVRSLQPHLRGTGRRMPRAAPLPCAAEQVAPLRPVVEANARGVNA